MRNFLIGFITAGFLFAGVSASTQSKPEIKGSSGRLTGIEVTDRKGDRVCEDPFYHEASKIISCE